MRQNRPTTARMEEEYLRIYKTQPLRAKDMLQEFSDSILIKGMELADRLQENSSLS